MRALLRPIAHLLKWPVRIGAFIIQFLHHLAAFFAWIWMLVNVAGSLAQAGLQANRLWEVRVLDDIWRDGMHYFSMAGGVQWQKILALALIPACLVAWRNAFTAFERFHAWVHQHHHRSQAGVDASNA